MTLDIYFSNQTSVAINFIDNEIGNLYQKIYKHLQHVPVDIKLRDNPYNYKNNNFADDLKHAAEKLNIDIDQQLVQSKNQNYLNYLHGLYEKNYNGNNTEWLEFHELIHLNELSNYYNDEINYFFEIDYRESAGPLTKPFKPDWKKYFTTTVCAGDVFIRWKELGKTPYSYWADDEPDNLDRICELAKPWLNLRPSIMIAVDDFDMLQSRPPAGFDCWWKQYEKDWLAHWNLDSWSLEDQYSVIVFGNVDFTNLNVLKNNLKNFVDIEKLKLNS